MADVRLYKFLVVPVLQQLDDAGDVVAELQPPEPDVVFGLDALQRYVDGFPAALERHQQAVASGVVAGANGHADDVPAMRPPRSRRRT